MRTILACALVLIAAPAFAMSEMVIDACLASQNPRACFVNFLAQERAAQQQRQLDAQVEIARQQAMGLALFGSGPAAIQGMNQGLQQMQVKPYVFPVPGSR